MADSTPTVSDLAKLGAVTPRDFVDAPERVREIAGEALETPASLGEAVAVVSQVGHFDPNALEEAVAALVMGHLILAGPPGTGKTSLAKALADSFNADLIVETANPEWSVFDTIGTQTLKDGGVGAKHGLVTNAVLACATQIVDNLDRGSGRQAVWLLIDEMNRAEIDRAFGPLFTALAGGDQPSMVLDHVDGRPTLALPNRFRVIATVNEYDTRFVNSMSGALRRRFSKVSILPPDNDTEGRSSAAEFQTAVEKATTRAADSLGENPPDILRVSLADHANDLRSLFGYIRKPLEGGVPVGTAQLIDVLSFFFVFATKRGGLAEQGGGLEDEAFWELLDRALVARLVPGFETDATRGRLSQQFPAEFAARFPRLPRTVRRLEAFLHGLD